MRIVLVAPTAIALAGIVLVLGAGGVLAVTPAEVVPVFLGLAVATTIAGVLLPQIIAPIDSLRNEVLVVALAAMITTGSTIAVAAAATMMIIRPGQFALLAIAAVMGAAFGIVVEYAVARDLSADALRLRRVARQIAGGEFEARSGVDRGDEIGQAARAIDTMATRLASLEAERTDAHAARQAFLAAVGHDLRTPLSALRAALDAIEDGLAPEPRAYFDAMRTDIEVIRRLVDDLFLLARIEGGTLGFDRVMADLAELADEAVEALAPIAIRKIVALRVHAEELALAPVGTSEISRVIRNLLDNAIRHAPDGSEVLVMLTRRDAGVVVRVLDQGYGFEPMVRGRVLEGAVRTARSEERGSGAGLGLAIVRGLIEAHGGRVWFEDGEGGRVAFWVPATS